LRGTVRRLARVAALAAVAAVGAEPPGIRAVPADALREARRLEAAIDAVRGLVARFTQTVESPGLPRPQVERGTLHLLRPDRMRWDYDEPRGKLAVTDGRQVWLYLPEERQVLRGPLGSAAADRGVGLLMREGVRITDEFLIDWGPPPAEGERARRPLRLTPRSPRAGYEHLLVELAPDGLVSVLTAVDALGGRVTYRFTLVRRVDRLDEDLFRFIPPPGVEVQDVSP
jgi:outer membrane lipoprotein carrier protein